MKEQFGEKIDMHIYSTDSEEAKKYDLRSSTNVFVNDKWVPLDIAMSQERMREYLEEKITTISS